MKSQDDEYTYATVNEARLLASYKYYTPIAPWLSELHVSLCHNVWQSHEH